MAAIDIIGSTYDNIRTARRQKEAEARVRIGHEMDQLWREFDALVLRSLDEGASISHIANMMRASRTTVYQSRDRAIALRDGGVIVDPLESRYEWMPNGSILVTVDAETLLPVIGKWDWDAEQLARAEMEGLTTQRFLVSENGTFEALETERGALADYAWNMRPIAQWFAVPANAEEARAWVAAHPFTGQVAA